jgi:hypothetical protein
MAATTRTKDTHEEALVGIIEQLADRVQLLEIALGTVVALIEGASGSDRIAGRMPEAAELLRRHEVSGRHPRWNAN